MNRKFGNRQDLAQVFTIIVGALGTIGVAVGAAFYMKRIDDQNRRAASGLPPSPPLSDAIKRKMSFE
jgi:hypothetical protein